MNQIEQFKEIKKEIIERAHADLACGEQYKRAYSSTSIEELCDVIKDNFFWYLNAKVIDVELIEKYKSIFAGNKIYCNVNTVDGFAIATGNATVKANDNATVRAHDNAYAISYNTIKCKLNDNAIYRIISTNEIRYCSDKIKFVKV